MVQTLTLQNAGCHEELYTLGHGKGPSSPWPLAFSSVEEEVETL